MVIWDSPAWSYDRRRLGNVLHRQSNGCRDAVAVGVADNLASGDGGKSWQRKFVAADFKDVFFVDAKHGDTGKA
jgi:hypothetical protein